MAEIKDVVKVAILIGALVFLGAMLAGFYFTVVTKPGQSFLVGGIESVLSAFFQFISAPFTGIANAITGFFSSLHLFLLPRMQIYYTMLAYHSMPIYTVASIA